MQFIVSNILDDTAVPINYSKLVLVIFIPTHI